MADAWWPCCQSVHLLQRRLSILPSAGGRNGSMAVGLGGCLQTFPPKALRNAAPVSTLSFCHFENRVRGHRDRRCPLNWPLVVRRDDGLRTTPRRTLRYSRRSGSALSLRTSSHVNSWVRQALRILRSESSANTCNAFPRHGKFNEVTHCLREQLAGILHDVGTSQPQALRGACCAC